MRPLIVCTCTCVCSILLSTVSSMASTRSGKITKQPNNNNNNNKHRFVTNKMCPFAHKAWLALEIANIPHELVEIDLYGANAKPHWFWKLNPAGTVPVLETCDDKQVYPDSDLILDAIRDGIISDNTKNCSTAALMETNSVRLQRIHYWRHDICNTRLLPIGKEAVLSERGGHHHISSSDDDNDETKKLFALLSEINQQLVDDDNDSLYYLAGDSISVADCHLFPFLWRLQSAYPFFPERYPHIGAWLTRCQSHHGVQTTIPLPSNWWWWW